MNKYNGIASIIYHSSDKIKMHLINKKVILKIMFNLDEFHSNFQSIFYAFKE